MILSAVEGLQMGLADLQKQVERLERDLTELRDRIGSPSKRWWVDGAGRFANDKEFKKIIRLGQKYRRSLRPKAKP